MAARWEGGEQPPGWPEYCSPGFRLQPLLWALALLTVLSLVEVANHAFCPQLTFMGVHALTVAAAAIMGAGLSFLFVRRSQSAVQECLQLRQESLAARETLSQAEARLRDCEARYRRLVELSPDAIALHQDGRFVFLNPAAARMLGADTPEELVGREVLEVVAPAYRELAQERIRQVLEGTGEVPRQELQLKRRDGGVVEVETAAVRLLYHGRPAVLVIARDITARRRAEAALRQSEARFRTIFENAPIGIGLMELDGKGLEVNAALINMLGYPQEELCRFTTEDLLHPEDVAERRRLFQELREGRRRGYVREARFIRKDFRLLWTRVHTAAVRPDPDGPLLLVGMVEDITSQKEAQATLESYQERLRSLAAELSLTEERERRSLAVDLHDQVSQPLALAKMRLSALKEALAWEGRDQEVREALAFLEEAIAASRALTSKLSPPLLFEGDWEEAVAWLAEQVERRHHLQVTVHRGTPWPPLPEAHRVLLFHILQELLTNAVKHSRARKVEIFLDKRDNNLWIDIKDDGIGFDVADVLGKSGTMAGFGLFSIRERLGHMGAHLEISSRPQEGTTVRIRAPLPEGTSTEGNHEDEDHHRR
ncbi:MAG: PAS domain S-box protein [Syntrophobacterales bacterium]|nr:PAS domain S-box protein [Syntrophobacterales bacterium]